LIRTAGPSQTSVMDPTPNERQADRRRRAGLARRAALRLEGWIERLRPPRRGPPVIEPYLGYATPSSLVLRGRVLTALRRTRPDPEHGRWANFLQMVSLFMTSEVAGVRVASGEFETTSDEEGHFQLEAPRGRSPPGWISVPLRVAERPETEVRAQVLVADPEAPCLAISDIDDTVLETGAHSLARNLWTSLTGSIRSRRVHEDAVALLRNLDARRAPIFYVSSGPWNLHHFLRRVFALNGAPDGPLFLRDFGLSEEPSGHRSHKLAAAEKVLQAHPDLPAILIGDTGQQDAEIYAEAARRNPGRVLAVLLREPRSSGGANVSAAMEQAMEAGAVVHIGARLPEDPAPLLRGPASGA
jgi:phosphatidate phosphatase APP1